MTGAPFQSHATSLLASSSAPRRCTPALAAAAGPRGAAALAPVQAGLDDPALSSLGGSTHQARHSVPGSARVLEITLCATSTQVRERDVEDPDGRSDCRTSGVLRSSAVVEASGAEPAALERVAGERPSMDAGPGLVAAPVEEQLSETVFGFRLGDPNRCRVAGTWER
jgi:hypothetical protein